MSPKSGAELPGYFPYVVLFLEGFWLLLGMDDLFVVQ